MVFVEVMADEGAGDVGVEEDSVGVDDEDVVGGELSAGVGDGVGVRVATMVI